MGACYSEADAGKIVTTLAPAPRALMTWLLDLLVDVTVEVHH
jgi:hypothetical protein